MGMLTPYTCTLQVKINCGLMMQIGAAWESEHTRMMCHKWQPKPTNHAAFIGLCKQLHIWIEHCFQVMHHKKTYRWWVLPPLSSAWKADESAVPLQRLCFINYGAPGTTRTCILQLLDWRRFRRPMRYGCKKWHQRLELNQAHTN